MIKGKKKIEDIYYSNTEIPNCDLNDWSIIDNQIMHFKDDILHNSQSNDLIKSFEDLREKYTNQSYKDFIKLYNELEPKLKSDLDVRNISLEIFDYRNNDGSFVKSFSIKDLVKYIDIETYGRLDSNPIGVQKHYLYDMRNAVLKIVVPTIESANKSSQKQVKLYFFIKSTLPNLCNKKVLKSLISI